MVSAEQIRFCLVRRNDGLSHDALYYKIQQVRAQSLWPEGVVLKDRASFLGWPYELIVLDRETS